MKFISLFAGIGGFDLGFERAGMTCAAQVEWDKQAQAVLSMHFPNCERFEDVRDVGIRNLPTADVLCGGFPCQDISLANPNPTGFDGARSGLWHEYFRIICELKPRWIVVENVRALLSSNAGRDFGTLLRQLSSVGYDAEWEVIPAFAVGAPHRRDRVWIVAYPTGELGADFFIWQWYSGIADIWGRQAEKWSLHRQQSHVGAPTLQGLAYQWQEGSRESSFLRVVDGFPGQLDRLHQCGNAVVPQITEWIGRRIVELSS